MKISFVFIIDERGFVLLYRTDTAEKIFSQLKTSYKDFESCESFGKLEAGNKLGEPVHLFDRIESK